MNTTLLQDPHFIKQYQQHLQYLKLGGLQPKTIEAYARAIRRMGRKGSAPFSLRVAPWRSLARNQKQQPAIICPACGATMMIIATMLPRPPALAAASRP
ncbi:hypothetical protein [Desulfobulbus propionicus]